MNKPVLLRSWFANQRALCFRFFLRIWCKNIQALKKLGHHSNTNKILICFGVFFYFYVKSFKSHPLLHILDHVSNFRNSALPVLLQLCVFLRSFIQKALVSDSLCVLVRSCTSCFVLPFDFSRCFPNLFGWEGCDMKSSSWRVTWRTSN